MQKPIVGRCHQWSYYIENFLQFSRHLKKKKKNHLRGVVCPIFQISPSLLTMGSFIFLPMASACMRSSILFCLLRDHESLSCDEIHEVQPVSARFKDSSNKNKKKIGSFVFSYMHKGPPNFTEQRTPIHSDEVVLWGGQQCSRENI